MDSWTHRSRKSRFHPWRLVLPACHFHWSFHRRSSEDLSGGESLPAKLARKSAAQAVPAVATKNPFVPTDQGALATQKISPSRPNHSNVEANSRPSRPQDVSA